MPSLSVVTVLYGGTEVLAETLPTWRVALQQGSFELVVIDNSPTSEPGTLVQSILGECNLQYVHDSSNPGFAASANAGARLAASDRVVFLNADVYLEPDSLRDIDRESRGADCAAVRLDTNGRITAGVEASWYAFLSDRNETSRRKCLGPSGGGGLVDRSLFLKLGGFNESFFAWGEDAAFALLLDQHGIVTRVLPTVLQHVGGHTVSSLAGQRLKARLLVRNRIWTLRLHYSRRRRVAVAPFFWSAVIANAVLNKIRQRTIRAYLRGVIEGVRCKPISPVADVDLVK